MRSRKIPSISQTRTGKETNSTGHRSTGCMAAAAKAPAPKAAAMRRQPQRMMKRCAKSRIIPMQSVLFSGFGRRGTVGGNRVDANLLHSPGIGLRHFEFNPARMANQLAPGGHAAQHGKDKTAQSIRFFLLVRRQERPVEQRFDL